ncbi:MAG: 4-hydroxy-3-methylbut-2-enyl diphosphate reductase, partial [Aquamicrobium sp.]|nr:4-hydroxy-3-methylbut-2-enyl diphosphate reductase [Aquamicrobium sp.]
ILVVGSKNSSNSNRLRELAENQGVTAYLIDGAGQIQAEWLEGKRAVGVTAGASAPELLVRQVVEALQARGAELAEEQRGREEAITFALPQGLRD